MSTERAQHTAGPWKTRYDKRTAEWWSKLTERELWPETLTAIKENAHEQA